MTALGWLLRATSLRRDDEGGLLVEVVEKGRIRGQ
jgi:hypothetical protein